jgi:hypothetical protein
MKICRTLSSVFRPPHKAAERRVPTAAVHSTARAHTVVEPIPCLHTRYHPCRCDSIPAHPISSAIGTSAFDTSAFDTSAFDTSAFDTNHRPRYRPARSIPTQRAHTNPARSIPTQCARYQPSRSIPTSALDTNQRLDYIAPFAASFTALKLDWAIAAIT